MINNRQHPLIGFCVSEDYYPGLLNLVTERVKHASNQATFIRFHLKDLDFEKLQVKGEKFQKTTETWEEGIFPFPSVVYMQCLVNQEAIKNIENVIGSNVFNSFLFDKWEGYNLLKNSNDLCEHLPNTQLLQKRLDFIKFLYAYRDIILKPINGYSSEGIYRMKFQKNKDIVVFNTEGKKMVRQEFKYSKVFWDILQSKFFSGNYIVQQSIETVKSKGNVSDIRLNMNKNSKGHWEMSLLLFRISTNNSIVIPKSIMCYTLDNFMNSSIYDKEKMKNIENSIISLGLKVCNAFDQSGYHMADLGIDLGLDENGHLWIFEVNPLPYPTTGSVRDYSLTRPVDYALYLVSKN